MGRLGSELLHTGADEYAGLRRGIINFSLLYRACFRVTQLLHQPLHIYKIYKILYMCSG